jgi:hypothetical protein
VVAGGWVAALTSAAGNVESHEESSDDPYSHTPSAR